MTNCLGYNKLPFQTQYSTSSPHIQFSIYMNQILSHLQCRQQLPPKQIDKFSFFTRCKNPQKHHFSNTLHVNHQTYECKCMRVTCTINTFAASYLNTQGINNSYLKSPASALVDLTFQSRALRSFSLNQLRNLSL